MCNILFECLIMTDPTLAKLRELLLNEFSEDELKTLCAGIGIDYDKLTGTGTFGKTRALLDSARSQDKVRALQASVRELRPAAYEAAGFATVGVSEATTSTSEVAPQRPPSKATNTLWPWLALAAVIVVCLVAVLALLLPRLQGAGLAATANTPAGSVPSQLAETALPTETPPAIVEVTDALDKGAAEMTATLATAEPALLATVQTPSATTDATATPESTPEAITATASANATATPAPTVVSTDTHPSAIVIQDLNADLPRFYRGEVDAQAIERHWTGEALRSVVGFGTQRLPRAMRITPDQRNTLQVTYDYRNGPTLLRESANGAIVTSREYWRYATSTNPTEICETRDYVYELVRVDGQYKVSEFSSRIVGNGCE
jgi:hypothetical protein